MNRGENPVFQTMGRNLFPPDPYQHPATLRPMLKRTIGSCYKNVALN